MPQDNDQALDDWRQYTTVLSAMKQKRFEAKQDILYRLDHIADIREDDHSHSIMQWADDGGRHVD